MKRGGTGGKRDKWRERTRKGLNERKEVKEVDKEEETEEREAEGEGGGEDVKSQVFKSRFFPAPIPHFS